MDITRHRRRGKDFIIDAYQIFESMSHGADAILLITGGLFPDEQIRVLYDLAEQLGMDVLVEVHDDDELQRALALNVAIIGVNNRNLHTFELSLDTTAHVFGKIPNRRDVTLVSEVEFATVPMWATVGRHGANAILVGEALIKSPICSPNSRVSWLCRINSGTYGGHLHAWDDLHLVNAPAAILAIFHHEFAHTAGLALLDSDAFAQHNAFASTATTWLAPNWGR
jgi:hypothetical protein